MQSCTCLLGFWYWLKNACVELKLGIGNCVYVMFFFINIQASIRGHLCYVYYM